MNQLRLSKAIPLLLSIILVALLYALSTTIPEETLRQVVEGAGLAGPVVLILLTLLTAVIAPLSGTPLLFVGFHLYGSQVILYSTISNLLATVINFYIARRWGRPLVERFIGQESMKAVDRITQDYGLGALLLLRVFQTGLSDFISYAAGLTQMRFLSYFVVSVIGMIPGTLLWYLISLQTESALVFTLLTWGMIAVLTVIFIAIRLVTKRIKKEDAL